MIDAFVSTDVSTAGPHWNHQLQHAGGPGCTGIAGGLRHSAPARNRCGEVTNMFSPEEDQELIENIETLT